jgi:hypothetical protein
MNEDGGADNPNCVMIHGGFSIFISNKTKFTSPNKIITMMDGLKSKSTQYNTNEFGNGKSGDEQKWGYNVLFNNKITLNPNTNHHQNIT